MIKPRWLVKVNVIAEGHVPPGFTPIIETKHGIFAGETEQEVKGKIEKWAKRKHLICLKISIGREDLDLI